MFLEGMMDSIITIIIIIDVLDENINTLFSILLGYVLYVCESQYSLINGTAEQLCVLQKPVRYVKHCTVTQSTTCPQIQ
jgi:hypothetical protein